MSLYNDGYSARAVALAMGPPDQQAQTVFTQNSTNNLLATDTFEVGNSTFTIVASIGSTAGNILKGANWLATLTNIINSLAASISGSGATANYVPLATPANVYGELGTNTVTFYDITPGSAGDSLASVYTASGTSGGSFTGSTFEQVSTTAYNSRAVDITVAEGLSVQFEIIQPIVTPAVFQIWSDIPSAGNSCVASGIAGNQQQMMDDDLCHPLTGAPVPMTVTIPATQNISGINIQGFAAVTAVSPVGAVYQGRPRCPGPGSFMFVKAISGDTQNVYVTALLSRLKYAN